MANLSETFIDSAVFEELHCDGRILPLLPSSKFEPVEDKYEIRSRFTLTACVVTTSWIGRTRIQNLNLNHGAFYIGATTIVLTLCKFLWLATTVNFYRRSKSYQLLSYAC